MAFTLITQGKIVQPSTAVGQYVNLPSSADYFKVYNLTQAAAAAPTAGVLFEWFNGVTPQGGALETYKSGSKALLQQTVTTGGFTYYTKYPEPEAAVTITGITAANPAVVTATNTYSNGDRVVIYGTTGMLQISGMIFTVSSVSGSGFTLTGLDASGFATPATAGYARRIAPFDRVEPEYLYITKITQASQAVVTVSQKHNYVIGQKITFQIPGSFGMVQLNNNNQPQNLPYVITAVTDYTMTINVDSTSFTPFAFPTSAQSPTAQLFATLAPSGQSTQSTLFTVPPVTTGYNFTYAPFHNGLFVPTMYLPIGADSPGGSANDVLVWQAYKMETGTIGV